MPVSMLGDKLPPLAATIFCGQIALCPQRHLQGILECQSLPRPGVLIRYLDQGKDLQLLYLSPPPASAIGSRYSWLPELDLTAMNRAASYLLGTHDFASFQAAGSAVVNTVRTLRHLFCRKHKDWLVITCIGDGFLYNMVRIVAGTWWNLA